MELLTTIFDFINRYSDLIVLLVTAIVIPLIKSTRWGQANEKALEAVVKTIEELDNKEVKEAVYAKTAALDPTTAKAIQDMAATVDDKKETPDQPLLVKLGKALAAGRRNQ